MLDRNCVLKQIVLEPLIIVAHFANDFSFFFGDLHAIIISVAFTRFIFLFIIFFFLHAFSLMQTFLNTLIARKATVARARVVPPRDTDL